MLVDIMDVFSWDRTKIRKTPMVQGITSDACKIMVIAALCRILRRRGVRIPISQIRGQSCFLAATSEQKWHAVLSLVGR